MYELWLCVVGGDDDEEILLYEGDSIMDVEDAIADAEYDVMLDCDKYFMLNGITFYTYRDFEQIRPSLRAYGL